MGFYSEKKYSIVTRDDKPFGLSYEEWTQKWWEWILTIPREKSPVLDETGKNCSQFQYGPIWFLAGTTNKNPHVSRNCTSPKYTVLLPLVNFLNLGDRIDDHSEIGPPEVSIDMEMVPHIEKYRVTTSPFSINITSGNTFDLAPGAFFAKSDGYWLLIRLPSGAHSINVVGPKNNYISQVEYNLEVKPFPESELIIPRLEADFSRLIGLSDDRILEVINQSAQSPRIGEMGNKEYDSKAVENNIMETLNMAQNMTRGKSTSLMEDRDITNAIIRLGLSWNWHWWPFCGD